MAKPKLALIPAAQGSKLFSVLPSSGVGDFDFTRSGKATRINSQGLIEEVSNGQSRLNYPLIDGKVVGCPHHILEPQRLNRVTNSEEFTGNILNLTVNRNQIISPNGSLNADRILNNNGSGEHFISNGGFSGSIVNGTDYVVSCFFKSDGTGGQGIIRTYVGAWIYAFFNLEDGTISYTSSGVSKIENYGNGWYRCSLSVTAVGDYATTFVQIGIGNSLNQFSYQGASSLGNYFWGVQFEQGSYLTSYIPTNGSAVTRSVETANGSGDADTFNDSEGVLMAEISALDKSSDYRFIAVSDGTNNNRVSIYFGNDNTLTGFVSGVSQFNSGVNILDFNKVLLKYKSGDYSFWVNGFVAETSSSTSGTHANLNEIKFSMGSNSNSFYGKTKQLQYHNSALTDSELEQLTSWTSFTDMAEGQLYTIE